MKNQNQGDLHENVSLSQLRRVIDAIMMIKELMEHNRDSELLIMANAGQDHYPQVFHSFSNIDFHSRN